MRTHLCNVLLSRPHFLAPKRARQQASQASAKRCRRGVELPLSSVQFSRCRRCQRLQTAAQSTDAIKPSSAKEAVESGLEEFKNANLPAAVKLFQLALTLNPTRDEARAAYYNLGCAHTKLKNWAEATQAIKTAVNDYDLKLIVPMKDDDLKRLRERREWIEALPEIKGSLTKETKVDLRAEAKAPFRFPRLVIFGSLATGAALGLAVITGRLIAAIRGGEGAPDLTESVQNFGINAAALGVLGFLVWRDLQGKNQDIKVVLREEDLAVLQVEVNPQRIVPLIKFRGIARPIILCGTKAYVDRAVKSASPYEQQLRARGVTLIPVVLTSGNEEPDKLQKLKEEFRSKANVKKAVGFGGAAAAADAATAQAPAPDKTPELDATLKPKERKFQYKPHDVAEWKRWIDEQREFAKLPTDKQNCYIQVQLDGRVRRSGLDMPPWATFIGDLPTLDSIRTSFTDGVVSDV